MYKCVRERGGGGREGEREREREGGRRREGGTEREGQVEERKYVFLLQPLYCILQVLEVSDKEVFEEEQPQRLHSRGGH